MDDNIQSDFNEIIREGVNLFNWIQNSGPVVDSGEHNMNL